MRRWNGNIVNWRLMDINHSDIVVLKSNVHDPRELATILQKAEADLAEHLHPDPYRRECWRLVFVTTV